MAVEDNYKVGHVIMITLSAAIGGFLFGFDSSVINGAKVALKGYFNCNDMQLGLAVSLALIGAAVGAYFAGRLADKFGRVRCMIAAAILPFLYQCNRFRSPVHHLRFHRLACHRWCRYRCGIHHRPDLHCRNFTGAFAWASRIHAAVRHRYRYLRGAAFELHHRPHFGFRKQPDYGH